MLTTTVLVNMPIHDGPGNRFALMIPSSVMYIEAVIN